MRALSSKAGRKSRARKRNSKRIAQVELEQLVEQRTRELEAERRLLRTVIDILPDYIYVKDRQSRFLVSNTAVAKNLGLAPAQVIGKSDFDYFPRELAEQYYADEQHVMETGEPLISREEPNYYPLTDSWGWHLTTTVPLRDARANVIGLVGVSRDITSHKRMEETMRESLVHQKFARQLIDSQERERKRIAAELHDDLGQNLLLAKNKLLLGLRSIAQSEDPSAAIHDTISLVSQSLEDVRDISHNLRPHQIDELGLSKGLEAMVRKFAETSELEFAATIEPADGLLPEEAEINLYRIAQESLNNIMKHSSARRITVNLSKLESNVRLIVADDGCGFDVASFMGGGRSGRSFGLMIMSERARMLGGDLQIHSTRGSGTTISVVVPMQRRNDDGT